jgi:hypothetical protein
VFQRTVDQPDDYAPGYHVIISSDRGLGIDYYGLARYTAEETDKLMDNIGIGPLGTKG